MDPAEAEALQQKYLRQRRKWLRSCKWPWKGHEKPEPGELDLPPDVENG